MPVNYTYIADNAMIVFHKMEYISNNTLHYSNNKSNNSVELKINLGNTTFINFRQ